MKYILWFLMTISDHTLPHQFKICLKRVVLHRSTYMHHPSPGSYSQWSWVGLNPRLLFHCIGWRTFSTTKPFLMALLRSGTVCEI